MRTLTGFALVIALSSCTAVPDYCAEAQAMAEDPNAMHEGRPVSVWLSRIRSQDGDARNEAIEALGRLGPHALCYAVDLTAATDSETRFAGAEVVRATARDAAQSHDRLLAQIAPTLTEQLVTALSDPDPNTRAVSAAALGQIGNRASVAAGDVGALLNDEQWFVRYWAVRALGDFGYHSISSVDTIRHMEHNDPNTRVRRACGPAAREIWADHALVTRHTRPYGGGLHRTATRH